MFAAFGVAFRETTFEVDKFEGEPKFGGEIVPSFVFFQSTFQVIRVSYVSLAVLHAFQHIDHEEHTGSCIARHIVSELV